MAATKKSTPKKKASTSKASAKKTTTRKASAKTVEMKSFKLSPEPTTFTTFKITKQTVYWIILVAFIIFTQLLILKMQIEVSSLIEAQQAALSE